ncbi:hypothetical protein FOA52_001150 [Chlamydomonas sp. UWO 241]|nr:hypothetical protein FOA52_001150 [Chlamydomonas sp. UWO 241]
MMPDGWPGEASESRGSSATTTPTLHDAAHATTTASATCGPASAEELQRACAAALATARARLGRATTITDDSADGADPLHGMRAMRALLRRHAACLPRDTNTDAGAHTCALLCVCAPALVSGVLTPRDLGDIAGPVAASAARDFVFLATALPRAAASQPAGDASASSLAAAAVSRQQALSAGQQQQQRQQQQARPMGEELADWCLATCGRSAVAALALWATTTTATATNAAAASSAAAATVARVGRVLLERLAASREQQHCYSAVAGTGNAGGGGAAAWVGGSLPVRGRSVSPTLVMCVRVSEGDTELTVRSSSSSSTSAEDATGAGAPSAAAGSSLSSSPARTSGRAAANGAPMSPVRPNMRPGVNNASGGAVPSPASSMASAAAMDGSAPGVGDVVPLGRVLSELPIGSDDEEWARLPLLGRPMHQSFDGEGDGEGEGEEEGGWRGGDGGEGDEAAEQQRQHDSSAYTQSLATAQAHVSDGAVPLLPLQESFEQEVNAASVVRPPPRPLQLAPRGGLAPQMQRALPLPLIGPWVLANDAHAFPHADVIAPVMHHIKARDAGYRFALRFEYIADRSTPGTPPLLHVFNLSRVMRKRHRASAAYINGSPLLPGGRGVPLRLGDVVELGMMPNRSNANTSALVLSVQPAGQPAALATAGQPTTVATAGVAAGAVPSGSLSSAGAAVPAGAGPHASHALSTYCSKYLAASAAASASTAAAAPGGEGPDVPKASASTSSSAGVTGGISGSASGSSPAAAAAAAAAAGDRLASLGPAAAIRALKAEVSANPGSTQAWLTWAQLVVRSLGLSGRPAGYASNASQARAAPDGGSGGGSASTQARKRARARAHALRSGGAAADAAGAGSDGDAGGHGSGASGAEAPSVGQQQQPGARSGAGSSSSGSGSSRDGNGASNVRPAKRARDLFRAALESTYAPEQQQDGSSGSSGSSGSAASSGAAASSRDAQAREAPSPLPERAPLSRRGRLEAAAAAAAAAALQAQQRPTPSPAAAAAEEVWARRRSRMQVLFNWAAFEWSQGLYGSARHLWRHAADLSYQHPGGQASAGGHALVMIAWVHAELESDNVGNARIILAEALRRSPAVQPLYVLGGSIELKASNLELAKAFCMKAYEMDRRDEELYLVWPRVEAAMGEPDRARVLYERGLEYHPGSVRIMAGYAEFEAAEGNDEEARDLHDRALATDPGGGATMGHRAAWAALELDAGQVLAAREILDEGDALQPDAPDARCLLVRARMERMGGNLDGSRLLLLGAVAARARGGGGKGGTFDMDAMKERALIHRAVGERALARSLDAHMKAMVRLKQMKLAGHSGWEAWSAFFAEARSEPRREVSARAHARKIELGLWSGVGEPVRAPPTPRPWAEREAQLRARRLAELQREVEAMEAARARAEAEAAAWARAQAAQHAAADAEAAAAQQQLERASNEAAAAVREQRRKRREQSAGGGVQQ